MGSSFYAGCIGVIICLYSPAGTNSVELKIVEISLCILYFCIALYKQFSLEGISEQKTTIFCSGKILQNNHSISAYSYILI